MPIVAKVYDTDASTLLRTLTADRNRNFRKVYNGVGSGGLVIPLSHADAAYIQSDRVVKFEVDGSIRFGIVIGPHTRHVMAEGEEAAQTVDINGAPGLLSLLGRAVIEHWSGTGAIRHWPDVVRFDFTHVNFDFSGWGSAVEIKRQGDTTGQWDGAPKVLTDHAGIAGTPDLKWIWPVAQTGGTPPQAVGKGYMLGTGLTLTDEGDYAILWAADDGARLFVDGKLVDEQTQEFMWRDGRIVRIFLDDGYHHIAVEVENIDRPSAAATNVAGFVMGVYSTTNGGELAALLYGTDNTWKALTSYPSTAPGMTPGKILDLLLNNAQVLGFIPAGVSWEFDADVDTFANAWATTLDVSYDVGANLLDVIANLVELAIDIDFDADDLVLHAYNKATFGTDLHLSVTVSPVTQDEDVVPAVITDALVKGQDGLWHWESSGASPKKAGRLDLGTAPSAAARTRNAQAVFDVDGVERVYATTRVRPVTGAVPFADFHEADTVQVGSDALVIDAIVVSEPDPSQDGTVGGMTIYDLEPVKT